MIVLGAFIFLITIIDKENKAILAALPENFLNFLNKLLFYK